MSYSDALHRVSQLQSKLGIYNPPVQVSSNQFDKVFATAQNRFNTGPAKLDTTVSRIQTSAPEPTGESFATGRSSGKGGMTPELNAMIERIAAKHNVPAALVKAVARAESGFRSEATSPAGAQGMMQLMPATGRGLGVTDPFNAEQSIEGGTRYLKNALRMFDGDTRLALAAYNAGPGAVQRYGGIPPYAETRNYVTRVMQYAQEFGLKV